MKKFLFLAFLVSGCATMSVDDFCHGKLPGFNEKLENALVVLRSWDPDRSLADVDEHTRRPPSIELSPDDRDSWSAWALARLKEVQAYQDKADIDSQFRGAHRDLTAMANGWVSFDGYASLSQVDRMIVILERIRHQSNEVAAKVCPSSSDDPSAPWPNWGH